MPAIDVYTPWQEPAATLEARTVARSGLLETLERTAAQHRAGGQVLPVYLFGPRGCGKSHVLTLLRHRLAAGGIPVVFVPEDIPVLRTADAILARIARQQATQPTWLASIPPTEVPERCVILFEAIHKHLVAFSIEERRKLRAHMDDRRGQWWIATGVSLIDELTTRDEPMFGMFNPFSVDPLSVPEGEELLRRMVPSTVSESPAWAPRARTLTTLAGGSPRTLVALGEACSAEPEAWASDHLHAVVRTFTAHYQMRFADLPPDGQRVVEALSESPRELGPTEIGQRLGMSAAHASRALLRLAEDGVLKSQERGRNTWYTLAEPLFRYWHEYRTSSWDDSRVGWVGRLVEAILSPDEMARAWASSRDDSLVRAIEGLVEKDPKKVIPLIAHQVGVGGEDGIGVRQLCLRLESVERWRLLDLATAVRDPAVRRTLRPVFDRTGLSAVPVTWEFEAAIRSKGAAAAFRALVQRLDHTRGKLDNAAWRWVDTQVRRALDLTEQRGAAWSLDPEHRAALARLPMLRARYLRHGKRPVDTPLLDATDLLRNGLPALAVDWGPLVVVAQHRQDVALWSSLVTSAMALDGLVIPANPLPAMTIPALAEEWFGLVSRAMVVAPATPAVVALTWAASAAVVSEDAFGQFAEALSLPRPGGPVNGNQLLTVEAALSRLARVAPGRLALLQQATSSLPWLRLPMLRAGAMASVLGEGQLHPELEVLRDLLGGDTTSERR